ncbi:hypothetical protein PCO31111_04507 [Pandoraea communis]|uniref:Uncharacterized protein n=1 Tax=Pandoraea communis TaxID=2508297 RepID=A0A5E4YFV6_9BURK|nr:hypothetical protein [Pandoraea communis]VVE47288.1 hypothetical protein PCO31111_04507 [Pandoraea communis]
MTDLNELWEQKKREVEMQLPRDVREAKRKSRFERINGQLRLKTTNPRRRIKRRLIEQASLEHLKDSISVNMRLFLKDRMEQK